MPEIPNEQDYVYADGAFMLWPFLKVSFKTVAADNTELKLNSKMCSICVAVDWNYKNLKQKWGLNYFKRTMKIKKDPIGLLYRTSA